MKPKIYPVTIYYEDTDFTGSVYHANYLKYMERARSEILGPRKLQEMYEEHGIGFVVYRAEIMYKKPARYGDKLEVHSHPSLESGYRVLFEQKIINPKEKALLLEAKIELVCVANQKLIAVPEWVVDLID